MFFHKKGVKFLSGQLFFFHQQRSCAVKDVEVVGNDHLRLCIAIGNNAPHFLIDLTGHILAVSILMPDIISEEDVLSALLIVDGSDRGGHAVTCHHLTGNIGSLLNILGCTGGNVVEDHFLRDPAAEADHDLLQHPSAGVVHLIAVGQGHCVAAGTPACRNDRYRINFTYIRQFMEQNGMAGLMIGSDPFLLFGDYMALLFGSDADLDKCLFYILLLDVSAVRPCGCNGSLVEKVFQVRAGETGCGARDLLQVYIVSQGLIGRMDFQDLLSSLYIGAADRDLSVKAAGTKDRRVKDIDAVGRRHDDDPFIDAETVHLDEQLVQGLLALIMGSAQACASAARDCVDFIDEDDAG